MDLAVLEIFRTVAQEQSVTRAAIRLNRVQSNVTTRIRQLEEQLGVQLFARDGKAMHLSEHGREFLRYTEQLLAIAEQARQAMHPERPAGRLRLGSMESTAASRLPQCLARFHREHGQVELELSTAPSRQLIDALLACRIDCALIASPARLDRGKWRTETLPEGVEGCPVFRERLMLVLPEGHPPVDGPKDLRLDTLGGYATGCSYRLIAEQWFAQATGQSVRRLKVRELGSYHAILASVSAGACLGIVPQSVLDLQNANERLVTLHLLDIDTQFIWRTSYATAALGLLRDALTRDRGHDERAHA